MPPNELKYSMPLSNDSAISGRRHHSRQWMAIPERFADGHDVGHDVLQLETPILFAHATEAHLHFIRDADPTVTPDHLIDVPQVVFRQRNLPAATKQRFRDEQARRFALRDQVLDEMDGLPGVTCREIVLVRNETRREIRRAGAARARDLVGRFHPDH